MTKKKGNSRTHIGDCGCGCDLLAVLTPRKRKLARCLSTPVACEVANLLNHLVVRSCPSELAISICLDVDKDFGEWFAILYPEYSIVPSMKEWLCKMRDDVALSRRVGEKQHEAYWPKYVTDKRLY